jgi:WD40 repeat protein
MIGDVWNRADGVLLVVTGQELMVLEGHPEEVYALAFMTVTTTAGPPPPPAAAAAGLPPQQQTLEPLLVAGSGESLFLWDLATQQLLQEAQPSSRAPHRPDWRPPVQPAPPGTAPGAAAVAVAQGRAAAGPGASTSQQPTDDIEEDEEEEEDWAPAYVFSLAASPALQLLATSSSDGVVRLFEARPSSRCLTEVAAAQVSSLQVAVC